MILTLRRLIRTRPSAATVAPLFAVALGGCDAFGPVSDSPERLVFAAEGDIYRMDIDGTALENLTNHQATYRSLDLSPDAERVTFHSDRSGCIDVWVMGTDGSDLTQLTGVAANERCNLNPRWSPDGTRIAFYSSRDVSAGLGWEAYVVNADGRGLVNIGNNPSTDPASYEDIVHDWSPDGRVAIHSNRDGTWATYLVNPDGSGVERFLDGWAMPFWSPDGTRIVYMTGIRSSTDLEVWVANADGSGAVNVSRDPGQDWLGHGAQNPWSPDGRHIAFMSGRTGATEVYTPRADGTGLTAVTDQGGGFLDWSHDGSRILLARDGVMNWVAIDGTLLTPVQPETGETGPVVNAVWLPRK